jgi:predicted nucleic acid-binding protein
MTNKVDWTLKELLEWLPADASDIRVQFWSMEELRKPFRMIDTDFCRARFARAYQYAVILSGGLNALRKDE